MMLLHVLCKAGLRKTFTLSGNFRTILKLCCKICARSAYHKCKCKVLTAGVTHMTQQRSPIHVHNDDAGWVKKTAIIMKGETKDRHNVVVYFKSNLCNRLYMVFISACYLLSIYLSLHRVPKNVGSMNKISPSIPILSVPISLEEGAASNDIIFPSLPCLLVPGTISIRMHFGRHMLLILQTWPNQDSCDSVMRARIPLGLNLQEEILKRTSSLR